MAKMGRPPNKICWENVDRLPNSKWRCKHCNQEFPGGASRIRSHLSRQGIGIRYCKAVVPLHILEKLLKKTGGGNEALKRPTSGEVKEVPSHSKEEAKRNSKKRGRNSFASGEGNDGIRSVANIGGLSTNKGIEQEIITDAIVEFFVSNHITLNAHAVNHPLFKTFLTRAVQPDVSSGIQKSLSNLEGVVNEYMVRVKNSWKTTGCTVICYKLDEWIGNPSNSEKDSVVYGFYCPKGFIFVQGPRCRSLRQLGEVLKNHVPNLLRDEDVTNCIYHCGYQMCENAKEGDDFCFDDIYSHCGQQQFQQFWKSICTKSGWVRDFMHKSVNLYEFMLDSFFAEGWRKVAVQNDGDGTPRSAFTRLRSIMHFEDRIKAYFSNYYWKKNDGDVREIINNNEFWPDGKELLLAVTPLLHITDLLDTLVPTSGYLPVAVNKAKDNLKPYFERDASKYQVISDWLDHFKTNFISDEVATSLSPFYDCGPEKWDLDCFSECVIDPEEEYENFEAEEELYKYNNPFANLSSYERTNHPVTLLKKHGGDFPVLQKYAIKYLSQPTSCMCNQVKKHILHCQGADNFILRLNYQMMQEFTELGDTIYKPLWSKFFPDHDHGSSSSSKSKHLTDDAANLLSPQESSPSDEHGPTTAPVEHLGEIRVCYVGPNEAQTDFFQGVSFQH